jgi:hypothetical protein
VLEIEILGEHFAWVPLPLPWMPMMTYFRMQLLSHRTGPLAPGHVARPLPGVTSLYHDIDTAPKAEVSTGRHLGRQRTDHRWSAGTQGVA